MDNPEMYEPGYDLARQCYDLYADQQNFLKDSHNPEVLFPFEALPQAMQRSWRLACLLAYQTGKNQISL